MTNSYFFVILGPGLVCLKLLADQKMILVPTNRLQSYRTLFTFQLTELG